MPHLLSLCRLNPGGDITGHKKALQLKWLGLCVWCLFFVGEICRGHSKSHYTGFNVRFSLNIEPIFIHFPCIASLGSTLVTAIKVINMALRLNHSGSDMICAITHTTIYLHKVNDIVHNTLFANAALYRLSHPSLFRYVLPGSIILSALHFLIQTKKLLFNS